METGNFNKLSLFGKNITEIIFVMPTLFCLVFFALLNHWLSRQYREA